MKRILSKALARCFPSSEKLASNLGTLAIAYGHWSSIRERVAVARDGSPLPWYTYPAIEFLSAFDLTTSDVFEFGSGNSSLYWANRARSVVSVEESHEWFLQVETRRRLNQTVLYRPDEEGYVSALSEQQRDFDIIVIDGKWRQCCAEEAPKYLVEGGFIILDNSDRRTELECGRHLRRQGFFQVDFSGFGPINGYCWTTSLFVRAATGIQNGFTGPRPIGGLR